MSKRFYIIMFLILGISVLLLGFSYARESGRTDNIYLAEISEEDYRIVFSNNKRLDTLNNNKTDISLINKSSEDTNYVLVLEEVNGENVNDVYYSLDDGEEMPLVNGIINIGELKAFGTYGDHVSHTIKITSDYEYEFRINVKKLDINLLNNIINNSNETYTDSEGNIRYYGNEVNNYINYYGHLYRIIGVVDGKIKLIDTVDNGLSLFNNNYLYPSLDDYLSSFDSFRYDIDKIGTLNSWMTEARDYWLYNEIDNKTYCASDTDGVFEMNKNVLLHYRKVVLLDGKYYVKDGDGTLDSPYEVTYGS